VPSSGKKRGGRNDYAVLAGNRDTRGGEKKGKGMPESETRGEEKEPKDPFS